jgi:hypothetical protein
MSLFPKLATGASAVVGATITYYSQGLEFNKAAAKPLGIAAGAVAVGQLASNLMGQIAKGFAPKGYGSYVRYAVHTLNAGGLTFLAKSYFNLSRNDAIAFGALTTVMFLFLNRDGGNGEAGGRLKIKEERDSIMIGE